MKSFVLIEPTKLFNLLNQESVFPCVSDLNYLVIYGTISLYIKVVLYLILKINKKNLFFKKNSFIEIIF